MALDRKAAEGFARYWAGRGDEKGETQQFWIDVFDNIVFACLSARMFLF